MSKNRRIASFILFAVTMSVALVLSGCQTLNWNEKWQSNFIDQMAVARDSQMLKNLVRMRYGEPPVFTTVEGVTEKYSQAPSKISLTGTLGHVLTSGVDNDERERKGVLSGEMGIGSARGTTFQYSPLIGKELATTMNQRLELATVFDLTQSGFSIERVLAITVERFGPVLNAPFASGPTPDYLPSQKEFNKYEDILGALEGLRRENKVRFLNANPDEICPKSKENQSNKNRKEEIIASLCLSDGSNEVCSKFPMTTKIKEKPRKLIACFLDDNRNCSCENNNGLHWEDWKKLKNLLNIEDEKRILILTDSETGPSSEVKVRTRSLFGVMHYLSQNVKVPDRDREIVEISKIRDDEISEMKDEEICKEDGWDCSSAGKRFKIISSDTQPQLICSSPQADGDCASVFARHNGHWFYINAKNHDSKATFALLTKLFEIQISGRETSRSVFLQGN